MGSIIAMVAVVTVVAGVATVATNSLHKVFSSATPKEANLLKLLAEWRSQLSPKRTALTLLKAGELDLMAYTVKEDRSLLRAKHRSVGTLLTIYDEPIAHYVYQKFPRAKVQTVLYLVQGKRHEYVFSQSDENCIVSIDGQQRYSLASNKLTDIQTKQPIASRLVQRDDQSVHIDTAQGKTIGILYAQGGGSQTALRALEFVDVDSDEHQRILELMTYDYLLTNNLTASS